MRTVVLGASPNPRRYSYRATEELMSNGYEVIPVGKKTGEILSNKIVHSFPIDENIHTIAMYLSPVNQKEYEDMILENLPERVIFNPGTHNYEFENRLIDKGVKTVRSCVLIMLSNSAY